MELEQYFISDKNIVMMWKKMFIFISFIFFISSIVFLYSYKIINDNSNIKIDELNQIISELSMNNEELRNITNGVNKKEIMKNHIKEYIKKRYKNIPDMIINEISTQVVDISVQYEVSTELMIGIMEVESSFNPMAISSKNARGLMQVMPEWANKFGLKSEYDLHNIDTGIESGIKVFKIHLEEANGNVSKGLYYYVNRDSTYASKVYSSVGQFVSFRSMLQHKKDNDNSKKEEVIIDKNNDINK